MVKKKSGYIFINIKITKENVVSGLYGRSAVEAFEFFIGTLVTSKHPNP